MYRFIPLRPAPGMAALRHTSFFSLLFAVFLIFQPAVHAQTTGTLSGTTYDQSGAIVAHAQVVMKNDASGITRQTVSNSAGVFSISAVPPGTYTVTVSAPGFTSWQESGIAFSQGASLNLPNIKLQVGATTNQVEVVSGANAVVPSDTSALNTTLNNHMVSELSIQGRDAGELIKIMPGMALNNGLSQGSSFTDRVTGSNSGPVGAYSANGTQPNGALAYMLDGANLVDPGNEGTQIANINQDMTSEVKVMTSAYGAEFARGPVVFEAYSKSGGAQFHGEGYLYARNGILNSEDSFQKSQGLAKPNDSYYYPGGNIGGPVLLPFTKFNHNRDKLFFWAGYEYMKQQPAGNLHEYFVPTAQMRQGNFSPAYLSSLGSQVASAYPAIAATPCAPTGSSAALPAGCSALSFPNGQIPQSAFDPNSLALLKLYPQPNIDPATHGGNNYEYLDNYPQNRYEATGKLDYNVSDANYNSLQASFQKQTGRVTFLSNYTFSKVLESEMGRAPPVLPMERWWIPSTSPTTTASLLTIIRTSSTSPTSSICPVPYTATQF